MRFDVRLYGVPVAELEGGDVGRAVEEEGLAVAAVLWGGFASASATYALVFGEEVLCRGSRTLSVYSGSPASISRHGMTFDHRIDEDMQCSNTPKAVPHAHQLSTQGVLIHQERASPQIINADMAPRRSETHSPSQ